MNTKTFLALLFLLMGNNFSVQAFATINYAQAVQQMETDNPERRFWDWYEKLDEGNRMAAHIFIRNFLLNEKNLSEYLNSFSSKKGQALTLSGFIKEAERSPTLREVLICTAYEGGSGCAP